MLPTKNGVGPSCIVLPPGNWPTVIDFLAERFHVGEQLLGSPERRDQNLNERRKSRLILAQPVDDAVHRFRIEFHTRLSKLFLEPDD